MANVEIPMTNIADVADEIIEKSSWGEKLKNIENSRIGDNLLVGMNQYSGDISWGATTTAASQSFLLDAYVDLVAGENYTAQSDFTTTAGAATLNLWKDKSVATSMTISGATELGQNQKIKTFVPNATGRYWIEIYANSVTTLTAKNVKIELGKESTPYCQNVKEKVDIGAYTGINLVVGANRYTASNPLSYSNTANTWNPTEFYVDLVKGNYYTLSVGGMKELKTENGYLALCQKVTGAIQNAGMIYSPMLSELMNGYTFIAKQTERLYLWFATRTNAGSSSYTVYDIKIELGTRATKYVPNLKEMQANAEASLKIFTGYYADVDLNTLIKSGVYKVSGNLLHLPDDITGNNGWGNLMVMNTSPYVSQFYHVFLTNALYIRRSHDGGTSWTAWSKL